MKSANPSNPFMIVCSVDKLIVLIFREINSCFGKAFKKVHMISIKKAWKGLSYCHTQTLRR